MLKTCASIQSFCCYTKVGLALAFPTLEAMGVECAPVPSCLLSTEVHGYGEFYIRSCIDDMKATFAHWNRENLKWDSIYTGFLSDPNQVDVIIDFVKSHKESLVMIDPAFGDDGKIYPGLSEALVEKMRKLVSVADITVPNPTEACFLLGKPQKDSMTTDEAISVAKELLTLGPKMAIMTSVTLNDKDKDMCYIISADKNGTNIVSHKKYHKMQHGTGDLFASIVLASLLHGKSVKEATQFAGDMVYLALKRTDEQGYTNDGHGVQSITVFPELLDANRKFFTEKQ